MSTFVPLLSKEQIEALPAQAREVVEYEGSHLTLNHNQGCQLGHAYCVPYTYGPWDQRTPRSVMPGAEAAGELVTYRFFMTGRTPLQDFLEVGALAEAVPCARHHVRQVLCEWRQAELAEDTELVVSELMTNAIAISREMSAGRLVRLGLLSDTRRVLVLVQDCSPQRPVRTNPEVGAEGGRGLLLVEAISSQWGWYNAHPAGTGKVTWALLKAPSSPPGHST